MSYNQNQPHYPPYGHPPPPQGYSPYPQQQGQPGHSGPPPAQGYYPPASAPQGQYPPASFPQGQYGTPQGQYPPATAPQGQYGPPQGQYPPTSGPPQGQYGPPQGQYPPVTAPQGQYGPAQGQYGAPQGQHPPASGPPQDQYGAPQGQYPPGSAPQSQYGAPQGQYGAPHGQYGQPPQPPQGGYHGAPPQGYPPAGYPPAPGQAPYPGHGYPPAPGPYGQHPPPQQYASPQGAPPAQPSPGYTPGQVAPGDYREQAETLRKAMKGIGTNEKALIQVLSPLDPLEMAAVRTAYSKSIGRDLRNDIDSETSGSLGKGLLAIVDGPLMHDVTSANEAVKGFGTKEWLLNEVLLGRSNADMNAIKTAYKKAHYTALEEDVEKDLSFKTAGLFKNVLLASRHEESAPVNPQTIESEVRALHGATSGRMVNDVSEVFGTFARSSDSELRAINQTFNDRYHTPLEQWIVKEFSGHMEDAFLHILRTALDPAMRDAVLLQDAMKGAGTDDSKLITRVVRLHWNRMHREQVKRAYKHQFKQDLIADIRSETSGDYERLMVALLE